MLFQVQAEPILKDARVAAAESLASFLIADDLGQGGMLVRAIGLVPKGREVYHAPEQGGDAGQGVEPNVPGRLWAGWLVRADFSCTHIASVAAHAEGLAVLD